MKISSIFLLLALSVSCDRKPEADNPPLAPTEVIVDEAAANKLPMASNSLIYLGTYKGSLPCEDCEGIEATLELSEDFSYFLRQSHRGSGKKPIEYSGNFSWMKDGKTIVLENIKGQPNKFAVAENQIHQLDLNGKRNIGDLASRYILKKIPESEAAKTDSRPVPNPESLVAIHWILFELNGKAVRKPGQKDCYVEFAKDGSFGAYAGCNHMGGKYSIKGKSITMGQIVQTTMACGDMEIEDRLKETLENSDNFIRNEKKLQLRKGSKIIAKFEAIAEK